MRKLRQIESSARWLTLLSVACATLIASHPYQAHAEPEPTSDERVRRHDLLTRANALWASQRYEEALRLYEQAYSIKPHPDVLYRIGQAHEQLGHDRSAATAYETYLSQVPDNPYADRIGGRIVALRQSERVAPPVLHVMTVPPGATLLLDGQPLDGVSPYQVESTSGNHVLTIRLEGYMEQEHSVTLMDGERFEASHTLEPVVEPEEEPEEEPELQEEPEPQSAPEKYELSQEVAATHVDISPPRGWKVVGHTMMIPGTFLLIVGTVGLAATGLYNIDIWGPFLLGGAAGVGIGSYILFIRKWEPRIKRAPGSQDVYGSGPGRFPVSPARRDALASPGGFRGISLKLRF